jgi:hypothetical protein
LTIVLSVLGFTSSDYSFGIFKLFVERNGNKFKCKYVNVHNRKSHVRLEHIFYCCSESDNHNGKWNDELFLLWSKLSTLSHLLKIEQHESYYKPVVNSGISEGWSVPAAHVAPV